MRSQDVLSFERPDRSYEQKLADEADKAGIPESVIYGTGYDSRRGRSAGRHRHEFLYGDHGLGGR